MEEKQSLLQMQAQRKNLYGKLMYLVFYKAESALCADVLDLPGFTRLLEKVVLALL